MNWLWWALGTFGIAGTAVIIAGFILGWPMLLQFFIGTKIGRIIMAIGAGVVAIFLVFAKGRAAGRAAERAKLKAKIVKEVAGARKEKARIDAMTDEEVDAELKRWDR